MGELRHFSFLSCCRAIPHLHEQFARHVPPEFWALVEDAAEVCCPCGHTPRVPYAIPTACDCDRWFLYEGRGVRVARYSAIAA
jgi:hypothetical protein